MNNKNKYLGFDNFLVKLIRKHLMIILIYEDNEFNDESTKSKFFKIIFVYLYGNFNFII